MALALLGLVLLSSPVASQLHLGPARSCIGSRCFNPDFLGGLGLTPRRKYVIAYGTDPVCVTVRDAVNAAIQNPGASARAVERPLPKEAIRALWPWRGQPVTTYETRNPIFASDIFLAWNWLDATVFTGAKPNPDETADDFDRARWLIAPVFNDGNPVLITQTPKLSADSWDVPEDQLDKHDWSHWQTYATFREMQSPCPKWPDMLRGPLHGLSRSCPIKPGPAQVYAPHFAKLASALKPSSPFYAAEWPVAIFNFARISGRFYAVLQTPYNDTLVVAKTGQGIPAPAGYGKYVPENDVCYLYPKLAGR